MSLIVPVFNEVNSIDAFLQRTNKVFDNQSLVQVEYVFVNDGSTDHTLERLLSYQANGYRISVVDLSRNFGKEAAITAGLEIAKGEVLIPIDVDLQDPPELIPEMIAKWREGYEVVLGRRVDRKSDSWFKQTAARWFYRIIHKLGEHPKLPADVGDFRLMDRKVVDALKLLPESRRFMKGLFAWVGFRTAYVDYERPLRVAGRSRFSGWKLWNFALEGLTSFSTVPLRVWSAVGLFVSLISFVYALFIMVRVLVRGVDVPGYASLMVVVTFLGGLQLIGIGVLGEYLGRTYIESKRRPVFVVRHFYESKGVHGPQGD
jgi:glycosyltransferase involved in cell wall biosynthesis